MTRPRGVFLSIDDPDSVEKRLANFGAAPDDIDLLVASDAEEILGIGDCGSNGIDISIGWTIRSMLPARAHPRQGVW
jgi:malate dehydrogenase (oxaloacetate-decarboxylating)